MSDKELLQSQMEHAGVEVADSAGVIFNKARIFFKHNDERNRLANLISTIEGGACSADKARTLLRIHKEARAKAQKESISLDETFKAIFDKKCKRIGDRHDCYKPHI